MGKKKSPWKKFKRRLSTDRLSRDISEGITELKGDLKDFEKQVKSFQPKDLQIKDAMAIFNPIQQKLYDWVKAGVKPKEPNIGQAGQRVNICSPDTKRSVIYGQVMTTGNLVFAGEATISSEKYWYLVLEICEGEIEAIGNVYLDDVISTDARFTGLVTLTKYTGTDPQTANSDLDTQFSSWTTDHKGNGVAYLVLKLKYHKDYLNSVPQVTCIVQGKKLYDVRTSTTAYSANAILAIYDFMTNSIYGMGIATADMHTQSFDDEADYCDVDITEYTAGGLINRFECNGVLDTANKLKENLDYLKSSCMASVIFEQGKYRVLIEKAGASTFSFTKDNIVAGSWSFAGVSLDQIKNRVKVSFLNAAENYTPDIATKETTVDNGMRLEGEFGLPFETNFYRASWFADTILKKTRVDLTCSFIADHRALKVQVGDIVDITHTTPGWTAKLFRVTGLTIFMSGPFFGCVGCEVIEHADTIYDRTVPAQDANPPNTSLPNAYNVGAVTSLSGLTGAAYNVKTFDGSINYRVFLSWTAPTTGYINRYEVQYKKSADSWGSGTIASLHPIEPQIYVEGLKVDTNYDLRVRAQNDYGVDGAWTTTTNVNPAQESDHFYVKEAFQSLDNWEVITSGTDVTYTLTNGVLAMTDSAVGTGDYIRLHRVIKHLSELTTPTFSKNRKIKFKFILPTLFTGTSFIYVVTGVSNNSFGLYIKSAGAHLYSTNSLGSNQTLFSTLTLSTARTYIYEAVFTSGTSVVGTIKDDLGNTYTVTSTLNLPTGTTSAKYAAVFHMDQSTGPGGGAFEASEIIVEQDP